MPAEHLAKLGQASLVTEWGRQGHSFVRYGIGSAQVLGGSAAAAHLIETLDAAASAGVYVLINLGVDELAHKRLGVKSKPNHTKDDNVTAAELWSWMKGNLSLVADHPAVGAFYGCDDCCHMGVISEYGMGEMKEIARIKRELFELDPHHLIWGSIACRELWMWGDESGNGLALDVTMKEAYSSGVGTTGLTAEAPALRSAQSVSTLRDFPMTFAPLVHMPSTQMASANMMRSHVYNTLTQLNTANSNYFVMNNNQVRPMPFWCWAGSHWILTLVPLVCVPPLAVRGRRSELCSPRAGPDGGGDAGAAAGAAFAPRNRGAWGTAARLARGG